MFGRSVIAILACVTLGGYDAALAGGGPENVLVVVNERSWSSLKIANHYIHLRAIPPQNVVYIPWTLDNERIDAATMREKLLGPVLAEIDRRRLADHIDTIAYSADFPTLIDASADILPGTKIPPVLTPIASLTGKHASAKCDACHTGTLYRDKLRTECRSCHAKDDLHKGSLGDRCETCHADTSWKVARFDHAQTRFALLGRHARIECNACHRTAVFREAPRECAGCHEADDRHEGTLGRDCAACHNARDWRLWEFDHRRTAFALDGAHASVGCGACHVAPGARVAKLSVACVDCHRRDDVHHGSFGPLCERCHGTGSFKEIRLPGQARRPEADGRRR